MAKKWCTQKAMATLFDIGNPTISKHLNHILSEEELDRNKIVSKMEIITQDGVIEGKTQTNAHFLQKRKYAF